MLRRLYPWLAFVVLAASSAAALAGGDPAGGKFLPPDEAFSYTQTVTEDGRVQLHWTVAPGYYMYRSRLKVEGQPTAVKDVEMPAGMPMHDPYFGDQQVFRDAFTATIDPGSAQRLDLTWQGCADKGLCYPPQHASLDVPAAAGGAGAIDDGLSAAMSLSGNATDSPGSAIGSEDSATEASASTGAAQAPSVDNGGTELAGDQAFAARLAGGHLGWTLAVFFGLGLLLTFTPCVLPMIPILSGVVVGAGARGLRGFTLSLAFVLPMALTYAVLGVAAALAGANLQAVLQTPAVLGAFAAIFVLLALSMFGAFELQLPAALRERLNRASANRRGGRLAGAAAMGVISAVLVGPCMTAPLAGALLYIANSGDAMVGGLALLALGLGMGVPLLVVGSVGAQLLPKPGAWMNAVKTVFGFVLLATALWMLSRVLPASIMLGLWGALALAAGVTLWYAAGRHVTAPTVRSIGATTAGLLLGLWGALMVVGAAGGAQDAWRPLAFVSAGSGKVTTGAPAPGDHFQTVDEPAELHRAVSAASTAGRWTVVDFYADWCVSCKVIDKTVFGDPKVQQALAQATLLRPDVTDDDAASRQLLREFNILGPPTILFISPDGTEQRAARVVGELSADDFLGHWRRARGVRATEAAPEAAP